MKAIIKGRWAVLAAWIIVIVGLFILAPNLAALVEEKGQIRLPEGYSSVKAEEILNEVQNQKNTGDVSTVALVFHDEKGLTSGEKEEAKKALEKLENNKEEIGITEIISPLLDEALEEQLISEDGNTILTSLSIRWNDREPAELSERLYEITEEFEVEHYYTSGWMIDQDLITSSQDGLKKTEGITVVFIVVVLLLVFKSFVAPFVPLITVGLSYLASQSIVSFLVDKLDFPISTYTQIFLVAVLFGIGTDYCILLLSRFKEELDQRETIADAIVETYRNAGRTVLFSGIAVMIGFAAIGFSQFVLYQSAAAVAVGVAILLLALFTVVPSLMMLLGNKLFWPSKGGASHKDNKLWEMVGSLSLKRPLVALLIVAAVCVPFLISYDGEISFNSLEEISDDAPSIKAFNVIADSFGPGEAMTTTVVLKNDDALNTTEYLALADTINNQLNKVAFVDSVRSVTKPTGESIEDLFISKQAEKLEEGLGEGKQGIEQISSGLHQAGEELTKSEPQLTTAKDGINELISGTNDMKAGIGEIQTNLAKIEDGIRQGSAGSTQIINGLNEAKAGAEQLLASHKKLQSGYHRVEENMATIIANYQTIGSELQKLSNGIAQIPNEGFGYLEQKYSGLGTEEIYLGIKGVIQGAQQGLPQLVESIHALNNGLSELYKGVETANSGYDEIVKHQANLGAGLEALVAGLEKQQEGLNQLADGQGQIVQNLPIVTSGLTSINDGQKQLLDGFSEIGGQLGQLTDGLTQSAEGLDQVSAGLGSATDYLSGLSQSSTDTIYFPQEVLDSNEFKQSLDMYLSADRKIMKFDVVFANNPYSNEAMDQVDVLKDTVERVTKDTKLENAELAIGGITSTNADLRTMSNEDYSKTVVFMLLGISIVLIFLFRSIIMPLYIIGSLILTFYTAMGINEVIFVNIFGYSGISWAVPFFAFVILMALGVDYSIFLMDRFNEYQDLTIKDAILEAMKKMGTVIISAVIILGGTFAAMMPAGMLSLLQIASIILVGLFLYAFVILPLFIPVMVNLFGKGNWWPFKRVNNE